MGCFPVITSPHLKRRCLVSAPGQAFPYVQASVLRPSSLVLRKPSPGIQWGGAPWPSGKDSKGNRLGIGSLWRFLSPLSLPLKERGPPEATGRRNESQRREANPQETRRIDRCGQCSRRRGPCGPRLKVSAKRRHLERTIRKCILIVLGFRREGGFPSPFTHPPCMSIPCF